MFVRFQGFRRIFKYYYDTLIKTFRLGLFLYFKNIFGKNLKFFYFLFEINIFLMFSDYFDVLISKIIFKK